LLARRFRLVPTGAHRCWLEFEVQRLGCRECGAVRQGKLPFAKPHKSYTRAYARYVLELSRIDTVKDVARHLGVSWDLVAEMQEERLERDARKATLSSVTRIALDELAVGKGQRYVSIVLDLDTGAAIHAAEGKSADSVMPFLRKLKRSGAAIAAVATDTGQASPPAVREVFPDAVLVYDHFHVAKLMNDKLAELRRGLQREADTLGRRMLRGTRWLLAKNPEDLDPDRNETERLREALEFNHPLAVAYYMKEDLRMFWEQPDAKAAERHLDIWTARARNSGIAVLMTMAKTLAACRSGLLNWYIHPISTGPLEEFNNEAQTMKRQAYGYRNMHFVMLKLRTLHTEKYALTG
jgi:transposase